MNRVLTQLVPFNRPHLTGREFEYIQQAVNAGQLAGNGQFTRRCQQILEERLNSHKVLLTHSCTAALEMAALLLDLKPGDEVIMPSFTFVSTANAFVLRGVVPVFVDIRPDTLNLDERLIEAAITPRTRAIVAVHYAGVGCDMDAIMTIATKHGLRVIEDAAQALGSTYKNRPLGSIGDIGALSFHETKNVISGEGGALLVNNPAFAERAEILWEKGTNRSRFLRGQVDKYTWVDLGSSFLPGELTAAFLWAQLEHADAITAKRRALWDSYARASESLTPLGAELPNVPHDRTHNAHLFYVLVPPGAGQAEVLTELNRRNVNAVFHYIPLHSAPAGRRYGRAGSTMVVTDDRSSRLIRLPLWVGMGEHTPELVVGAVAETLGVRA
jgi:dTDP-4-amino-4,6-dideoxygalactose transaminase